MNQRKRVNPYEDDPYTLAEASNKTNTERTLTRTTLRKDTNKSSNYENRKWIEQKKKNVLLKEGYIFKEKIKTKTKNEIDKAIRKIRGNKELRYIPTEEYLRNKERIDVQNMKKG